MKVALAGGTGALGRYLVDAFIEAGQAEDVIVLSRSTKENSPVSHEAVDYDDVVGLTSTLKKHSVDTVVCVLVALDQTYVTSQLNLLNAAKAAGAKRFIPSEWGGDLTKEKDLPSFMQSIKVVRKEVEASGLEYTYCNPGQFMDYLLPGGPKYHHPWPVPVVPTESEAIIPGDGNTELSMTLTTDIARAMLKIFDAPAGTWEPVTAFNGDVQTWNKILAAVETKFDKRYKVHYKSEGEMRKELADAYANEDYLGVLVSEVNIWASFQGGLHLPQRSKILDGLTFITVQDVLNLY